MHNPSVWLSGLLAVTLLATVKPCWGVGVYFVPRDKPNPLPPFIDSDQVFNSLKVQVCCSPDANTLALPPSQLVPPTDTFDITKIIICLQLYSAEVCAPPSREPIFISLFEAPMLQKLVLDNPANADSDYDYPGDVPRRHFFNVEVPYLCRVGLRVLRPAVHISGPILSVPLEKVFFADFDVPVMVILTVSNGTLSTYLNQTLLSGSRVQFNATKATDINAVLRKLVYFPASNYAGVTVLRASYWIANRTSPFVYEVPITFDNVLVVNRGNSSNLNNSRVTIGWLQVNGSISNAFINCTSAANFTGAFLENVTVNLPAGATAGISGITLRNSTISCAVGCVLYLSSFSDISSLGGSQLDVGGQVVVGQGESVTAYTPFTVWSSAAASSLDTNLILRSVAALVGLNTSVVEFVGTAVNNKSNGLPSTALQFRAYVPPSQVNLTKFRDTSQATNLAGLQIATQNPPTLGERMVYITTPIALRGLASKLTLQSLVTLVLMKGFTALEGTLALGGTLLLPSTTSAASKKFAPQASATWTGVINAVTTGQADLQIADTVTLSGATITVPTTVLQGGSLSGTGQISSTLTVYGTLKVGPTTTPITVTGLTTFAAQSIFTVSFSGAGYGYLAAQGGVVVAQGAALNSEGSTAYTPSAPMVFMQYPNGQRTGSFFANRFIFRDGTGAAPYFDDASRTLRIEITGKAPDGGGASTPPTGFLDSGSGDNSSNAYWIIPVAVCLGILGLILIAVLVYFFHRMSATTYPREPLQPASPVRSSGSMSKPRASATLPPIPDTPYYMPVQGAMTVDPYAKPDFASPWEYPLAIESHPGLHYPFASPIPQPSPSLQPSAYFVGDPFNHPLASVYPQGGMAPGGVLAGQALAYDGQWR